MAQSLIQRIYREAVGRFVDEKSQELVAALLAYPGTKSDWRTGRPGRLVSDVPVIPITFVKEGQSLSYFSMITTVATPQTVAAQELRIESMFPLDDETEAHHSLLMGDAPGSGN